MSVALTINVGSSITVQARDPRIVAVGVSGPQGPTGATGSTGDWSTAQTIRTDSSTSSTTLASTDAGKLVRFTSASAITVTLRSGASGVTLTTGQRIDLVQTGAGQVTFAGGDHTLLSTPTAKLRAVNSAASIICLDASSSPAVYLLTGDTAASLCRLPSA